MISLRGAVPILLSFSLALSAAACGGGGGGGGGDGCTAITDTSLTNLQAQIFTPNCALTSCHGAPTHAESQDLSDGHTFTSTVGVASLEQPSLMRVKPSDHANSFLFQKINLPTSATSMPPFQPLCQEKIDAIQAWIDAGAPDN
jgi:hypothetical protein